MSAAPGGSAPLTPGAVSERRDKIAASKIGCSLEEYRYRVAADEYWCGIGKHWVTREEFSIAVKGKRCGRCHECRSAKRDRDTSPAYLLTPEGAARAYPTAAPSGHIYRQVDDLRPMQVARLERMRAVLGVPVTGVVRVEAAS